MHVIVLKRSVQIDKQSQTRLKILCFIPCWYRFLDLIVLGLFTYLVILSRFVFIRSVLSVLSLSSQCFCLLCYGHDSDRQPYVFKMTFGFTLEVCRLQIWPGEFGWIRMNFGFYHYPKLKPNRDFTRLNFLKNLNLVQKRKWMFLSHSN